eukprot:TRINITY_DN18245_c0_g1_i1.p1 TRINITY_DN18245_c0_g1~~TRINITY_DN18245_c0_g1_i1.p1  ORF type:complete len:1376 (-),score=404.05 TRINITY_DN18245_c0_g1_i1:63-4190(-)
MEEQPTTTTPPNADDFDPPPPHQDQQEQQEEHEQEFNLPDGNEEEEQDGEADDYSDYSAISDEPPIIFAAARGDIQMLRQILSSPDREVEMRRKSREGKAPALFAAAFRAELECIKLLLAHGADINETDSHNRTPLFVAAYNGSLVCVQELITQGADLTIKDNDDTTTLHVAVASGNSGLVEFLLGSAGSDVVGPLIHAVDKIGRTALHFAVSEGHQEIAQLLIRKAAKLDVQAADRKTALHMAAERGYHSLVELLLYEGAEVELPSDTGCTALHLSASNGHASCVSLLLSYGARVDAADLNGNTALHYACFYSHLECVQVLLSRKANPSSLTDAVGRTALDVACNSGAVFCCQELLACEAVDIDHRDLYGRTPLFRAAILSEACTQLLIERSAHVHAVDVFDRNALHYAAYFGRAECARMLLLANQQTQSPPDSGENSKKTHNSLLAPDKRGMTPVHAAACTGSAEVLRLFVESGANMEAADDKGLTPWHYVAKNGDVRSARLLLGAGVDPNVREKCGQTALHVACLRGHGQVVQLLLTLAPLPTPLGDSKKRTPLHYAAISGNESVVEEVVSSAASRIELYNCKDSNGRLPLHLAALYGNDAVCRVLMDLCFNGDEEEDNENAGGDEEKSRVDGEIKGLSARDSEGRTVLHLAAASAKESAGNVIDLFLDRSPALATSIDSQGRSPHHLAAYWGRIESLHRLQRHPPAHSADQDGRTPLFYACSHGRAESVEIILQTSWGIKDINRVDKFGRSPLLSAIAGGNTALVDFLIRHGADINLVGSDGESPIHLAACVNGETTDELVMILIEHGCRGDDVDHHQRSALHWAAHFGSPAGVRAILRNLPEISTRLLEGKDEDGRTPLDFAAFQGHAVCVALLLEAGANPLAAENKYRRIALHAAAYEGHWKACAVLLAAAPLSVQCVDDDRRTALHRAAWRGHSDCVEGLIENGADVSLKDRFGFTAFQLAQKSHQKDVLDRFSKLRSSLVSKAKQPLDLPPTTNGRDNVVDVDEKVPSNEISNDHVDDLVESDDTRQSPQKGEEVQPVDEDHSHQAQEVPLENLKDIVASPENNQKVVEMEASPAVKEDDDINPSPEETNLVPTEPEQKLETEPEPLVQESTHKEAEQVPQIHEDSVQETQDKQEQSSSSAPAEEEQIPSEELQPHVHSEPSQHQEQEQDVHQHRTDESIPQQTELEQMHEISPLPLPLPQHDHISPEPVDSPDEQFNQSLLIPQQEEVAQQTSVDKQVSDPSVESAPIPTNSQTDTDHIQTTEVSEQNHKTLESNEETNNQEVKEDKHDKSVTEKAIENTNIELTQKEDVPPQTERIESEPKPDSVRSSREQPPATTPTPMAPIPMVATVAVVGVLLSVVAYFIFV